MPRTVTVTFEDGSSHVYQGAPDDVTPDVIQSRAQQEFGKRVSALDGGRAAAPEAPGMAQGVTQAFGRGASFGLSDRLGALASSAIGGVQDAGEYGDYGGTYSENLKSIQDDRDQFAEAHPVADMAANVAGGIVSGVPIAKAASAVPAIAKGYQALDKLGKGAKAAKYATTGALAGGAAGAGNAAESDVLEGAGTGAMTGAVLGAVAPAALKGAGVVLDKTVGPVARGVVNAFRAPEQQSVRTLAKNLARDDVSVDALESRMRDLGPGAMFADAAGKNTLASADLAATVPGQAKDASLRALEERAKGAGGRVVGALNKGLGVNSTNVDELQQGLHQNMRDVAAQHGYDDILNTGQVELTPELEKLMGSSTMKRALGAASSILDDDIALGRADSKLQQYFKMDENGSLRAPFGGFAGDMAERPTLRAWDYVKRGLDSVINDGTDAITGKMSSQAERANSLKRELLKHLDNGNDAYKAVRGAYADEKAGESAMQMGRAFLRDDSEVTTRHIKSMSPAEQQYFRAGAARAVYDKIMSAPNTGMAYSVFLKRPLLTEKLRSAFGGDTPEFQTFMKQLGNEARMGETHAAIGKNSMTAARQAVAQDQGTPITTATTIPTNMRELARSGFEWAARQRPEVSGANLDALTTQDPAKQSAIIAQLRALDANMQKPILSQPVKSGLNYIATQQGGQRMSSK